MNGIFGLLSNIPINSITDSRIEAMITRASISISPSEGPS